MTILKGVCRIFIDFLNFFGLTKFLLISINLPKSRLLVVLNFSHFYFDNDDDFFARVGRFNLVDMVIF